MTEAGLKTLIETALSIPVFEGKDSIVYPAATLEVLKINPALYGDGHSVARTAEAQINLWYQDKAARDAFRTVQKETPLLDAVYIVDIIREKWQNDDPRIQ